MGTEKTHFHPCKIIQTITMSCKYQSNYKSTQNSLDTKPWKGCENRGLAAEKRVKIGGVIAGGVALFVVCCWLLLFWLWLWLWWLWWL